MKDEDLGAFRNHARLEGGIRTAVKAWCADGDEAKDQYGPIASWNTSEITNMEWLFDDETDFNEDISRWEVSKATTMFCMFVGATSFDQQLGGAWARSTAFKKFMFDRSAGSIVGKTNDVYGTPR